MGCRKFGFSAAAHLKRQNARDGPFFTTGFGRRVSAISNSCGESVPPRAMSYGIDFFQPLFDLPLPKMTKVKVGMSRFHRYGNTTYLYPLISGQRSACVCYSGLSIPFVCTGWVLGGVDRNEERKHWNFTAVNLIFVLRHFTRDHEAWNIE